MIINLFMSSIHLVFRIILATMVPKISIEYGEIDHKSVLYAFSKPESGIIFIQLNQPTRPHFINVALYLINQAVETFIEELKSSYLEVISSRPYATTMNQK